MADVICKEVVITTLARRGAGVPGDPVRRVTQVYDKGGTLIAEYDPQQEKMYKLRHIIGFAKYVIYSEIGSADVTEGLLKKWLSEQC